MKKILLIEDDSFISDLYIRFLKKNGYEVDLAEEGKGGYNKIVQGQYDLILLDIMLPTLDGISILTKLKEDNINHAPIIICSNLSEESIVEKGISLGAIGYMIKSELLPKEIIDKINKYFETGKYIK